MAKTPEINRRNFIKLTTLGAAYIFLLSGDSKEHPQCKPSKKAPYESCWYENSHEVAEGQLDFARELEENYEGLKGLSEAISNPNFSDGFYFNHQGLSGFAKKNSKGEPEQIFVIGLGESADLQSYLEKGWVKPENYVIEENSGVTISLSNSIGTPENEKARWAADSSEKEQIVARSLVGIAEIYGNDFDSINIINIDEPYYSGYKFNNGVIRTVIPDYYAFSYIHDPATRSLNILISHYPEADMNFIVPYVLLEYVFPAGNDLLLFNKNKTAATRIQKLWFDFVEKLNRQTGPFSPSAPSE